LLALLAIMGYAFRVPQLYSIAALIPIALNTALGFLLLALGIVTARPSGGLLDLNSRLLSRLYFGYFILIFLMTSIMGVLIDSRIQQSYLAQVERRLQHISQATSLALSAIPRSEWNRNDIKELSSSFAEPDLQLAVLDTAGQPLLNSRQSDAPLSALNPEISPMPQPEKLYRKTDLRQASFFVNAPVLWNSQVIGYLRAGFPVEKVEQGIASIRDELLLATVAAFLLALAIGYFFARRLTDPLTRMSKTAEAIADGNFKAAPPINGKDEIAQLGQSLRTMADKLAKQMADLECARQESDAANSAKSRFLANLTHEIRTPLTAVIGMTGLLARTELSDKQRRYVEVAQTGGNSLNTLINNILDLSKAEAGRMELEIADFDLVPTVEDVIELLNPRALSKGLDLLLHIAPETPTLVCGDAPRLKQILVNLVGNAVKFTDQGQVMVRVKTQEETPHHVVLKFEVLDSGNGIPSESIDKLFQPFSQASASTARTHGGSGLGLSIAKQLVELMNGSIGISSTVGKGTLLWFTIQVGKQSAPRTMTSPSQQLPQLKFLVVERNATHRALLCEHIEAWKMPIKSVANDDEALVELSHALSIGKPYTVILMEMSSENLAASPLLDAIQSNPRLRGTVLIALLSLNDDLDSQTLRERGFASHLVKPVRQSTLLDAVMNATISAWHLEQAKDPASANKPMVTQPVAAGRILLVEDNIANQLVAGEIISGFGFQYDIASNGQLAVEAASRAAYDLILMDCQMPVMDGFEATRRIREAEMQRGVSASDSRRIPIIALTANAISIDRERCLKAGMDAYCLKPIHTEQLFALIRQFILTGERSSNSASYSAADLPASDKPLDLDEFLRRCLHNRSTALKALREFEKQLREESQLLEAALLKCSFNEAYRLAHSLRGVSATACAPELSAACEAIEAASRKEIESDCKSAWVKFSAERARCLAALQESLAKLESYDSQKNA
ncbi:MAG: response regulator, partial [Deltaproteobacteria bacterium]|nr:response regulator [Deltaproteobacteria bacterium]